MLHKCKCYFVGFLFLCRLPWCVSLQSVSPLKVLDEAQLVLLCGAIQRGDEACACQTVKNKQTKHLETFK